MTRQTRFWISVYLLVLFATIIAANELLSKSAFGVGIIETRWGLNLSHYSEFMSLLPRSTAAALERASDEERTGSAVESPRLSHSSGLYPGGVTVSVTLPENARGYFSLDGSIPTTRHRRVSGPIIMSESATLRVKAFLGTEVSETVTASYIVESLSQAVVADLVLDPVLLFNHHAGIYSNPTQRGRVWERPAVLVVIDPARDRVMELDVRVRIHGGASRGAPNEGRKNFRILTERDAGEFRQWMESGSGAISPQQSEWILRHAGNERQFWSDRFAKRVAHQLGLPSGTARPLLLHVNGHEWGVYDIFERVNKAFLRGRVGAADVTLLHGRPLTWPLTTAPDYSEWNRLYHLIASGDLSDPALYSDVESRIDVPALIDYFVLAIFMADTDRPHGNIDLFREKGRSSGRASKWRFAVWDFDQALNYRGIFTEHDTLAWHLRAIPRTDLKPVGLEDNEELVSATTLLRSFMRNDDFRRAFKQRFTELLASTLSSHELEKTLDGMLADYAELLPFEKERFGRPEQWLLPDLVYLNAPDADFSYADRMREIRTFISERPRIMADLLAKHLGTRQDVGRTVSLELDHGHD